MIKYINKKTGEIKTAFSARKDNDKIIVRFSKNGKEYSYFSGNIELLEEDTEQSKSSGNNLTLERLPFTIYKYRTKCFKCHKETEILTYIIFADGTNQNVTFPWDKPRLLEYQNIFAHMQDPSIEYYGLLVLGDYAPYDKYMLELFPDRISVQYSKTVKKSYAMNTCEHCHMKQGNYFIYQFVNMEILEMHEIAKLDILKTNSFISNL